MPQSRSGLTIKRCKREGELTREPKHLWDSKEIRAREDDRPPGAQELCPRARSARLERRCAVIPAKRSAGTQTSSYISTMCSRVTF